ncbi:MAG: hypothetical protein RBT05_00575 [Bacteroidales bacterium]|nr:hypothetical protein [Bacteroidales bacterium]
MTTYIRDTNGNKIILKTANNERIVFQEHNYNHAFSYCNKDYDKHNPISPKRIFSYQRARRVLWIKDMITSSTPNIVRKDIGRDVYFYDQKEKYVVILIKSKNGNLYFKTHYLVKNKKSLSNIENKLLY